MIELDSELLEGIGAFCRQQNHGAANLSVEDAVNVIVRDWLQGQGFMAIQGEGRHRTAREAAGVPSGEIDP